LQDFACACDVGTAIFRLMVPVLEAVPNFSTGTDRTLIERLVRAVQEAGAEVLDWSADADHNRAVLTFIGSPDEVEEGAVAAAALAAESIDLRGHRGSHPRIGALDVLPFIPLSGLSIEDARASAHRVGRRLAEEVGVPIYFYGEASEPRGRGLAELRAGGVEALLSGFPPGREPDLLPSGWQHPGAHPTAGATCVGARPLLLAWNLEIEGLGRSQLDDLARAVRERGGGVPGLRALALVLGGEPRMQLSMNLEDVGRRDPFRVFRYLEDQVQALGGTIRGTEVIGMIPDSLLLDAGADRIRLLEADPGRILTARLQRHIDGRVRRELVQLMRCLEDAGEQVPTGIREAVGRLAIALDISN